LRVLVFVTGGVYWLGSKMSAAKSVVVEVGGQPVQRHTADRRDECPGLNAAVGAKTRARA
jgi:hypothetical protein